jgi:hypothetical protein
MKWSREWYSNPPPGTMLLDDGTRRVFVDGQWQETE